MADEFGDGVGLDPVGVNLLGQLIVSKLFAGTAEGGFTGNLPAVIPAAKGTQHRAGLEGVQERAGGGELIDVLGNEGVRQPGARAWGQPLPHHS